MLSCKTIYAVSSVQKYSYHVQLKEKAKSAFLLIMKKIWSVSWKYFTEKERIKRYYDIAKKNIYI